MNKTEQSRIAFDQQADTYDSDFHGKHARELYPFMLELMIQLPVRDVLDKTTPRLIQFHIFKNAVNPPFLGGFSIFATVAA